MECVQRSRCILLQRYSLDVITDRSREIPGYIFVVNSKLPEQSDSYFCGAQISPGDGDDLRLNLPDAGLSNLFHDGCKTLRDVKKEANEGKQIGAALVLDRQ